MQSLYRFMRKIYQAPRGFYLRRIWGYQLAPNSIVSLGATLDRTNPKGIVVGSHTIITRGATVLAHDYCRGVRKTTTIGDNCFVGVGAVILPGVTIGNGSIVGAGAVVVKDVPAGSLVVGNPARILRSINVREYGKLI